ncbi:MAG: T9SS type B sorting domain-containing protein, partial [Bacteroidales bacterium]
TMIIEAAEVNSPKLLSTSIPTHDINQQIWFPLQAQGGTPPYTFEWNDGSPFTTGGNPFEFNSTIGAGSYKVTLTLTDKNCKTKKEVNVQVNPNPVISITPNEPIICQNVPLTLTASVLYSNNYKILWTDNLNKPLGQGTTINYVTNKAGDYFVRAVAIDNVTGCNTDTTEYIVVRPVPNYSLPKDTGACLGQPLLLNVNPRYIPNAGISTVWTGPNLISKSKETAVYQSNNFLPASVIYTITDINNCPKTDTINIKMYNMPSIDLPATLTLCEGNSLIIEATPGPLNGDESVIWKGNGEKDLNNDFLFKFLPNDAGNYRVEVVLQNQFCKDTATTTVRIHTNPKANIVYGQGFTTDKIPMYARATLAGEVITGWGTPPYVKKWQDNKWLIREWDSLSHYQFATTLQLVTDRQFTYTVTDVNGCTDKKTVLINVQGDLEFQPYVITTKNPDKIANPIIPINPRNYLASELNKYQGHLCFGDSIQLAIAIVTEGSGSYNYLWTLDQDPTWKSTLTNPFVTPKTTGILTYRVTVSDKNFPEISKIAIISVYSHVVPQTTITTNQDIFGEFYVNSRIILYGNPIIPVGETKFEDLWTSVKGSINLINPKNKEYTIFESDKTDTYIYKYTVSTQYCSAWDTITLKLKPGPRIELENFKNRTCLGNVDQIKIQNPDHNAYYVVTVSGGATFANGETTIDMKKEKGKRLWITWQDTGTYIITVTDISEDSRPKQAYVDTVIVSATPIIKDIVGPRDVCEWTNTNYAVALENASLLPEIKLNVWSIDLINKQNYPINYYNGKINGAINTDYIDVSWGNISENIVKVIMSNRGCIDSAEIKVNVHHTPNPDFTTVPQTNIYTGKTVVMKNLTFKNDTLIKAQDTAHIRFFWDFITDQIYTSEEKNPKYIYKEAGIFDVTLIAMDTRWGCKDSITKQIKVDKNPNCNLVFPNTFTPNANQNTRFKWAFEEGIEYIDYTLKIYNRWGQLLWQTNDKYASWDGTYNGKECKQDVYVYQCQALCETGDVININGNVTLVR